MKLFYALVLILGIFEFIRLTRKKTLLTFTECIIYAISIIMMIIPINCLI